MPIEAITPIWYKVVATVGQIVPVTYWWSCVAYSGLLEVAKSVMGSFFSRLGRFNRGSKSAREWGGRQHRECSPVGRISGRTNGRGKCTKSGSNTSVGPVSYGCRTKIVLAVLDRQRLGVKATIWWFCHDHDRSGRSMIGNIAKNDRHSATWSLHAVMIAYHMPFPVCLNPSGVSEHVEKSTHNDMSIMCSLSMVVVMKPTLMSQTPSQTTF